MKKLTAGFCAIALAAVPTAQAMAAPSIGTSGPKDPVVEEGTLDLKDGAKLVIKEVTPDLYKDNDVADVVENFNDEEKLTSVMEVNNSLQLKLSDAQADAQIWQRVRPLLLKIRDALSMRIRMLRLL